MAPIKPPKSCMLQRIALSILQACKTEGSSFFRKISKSSSKRGEKKLVFLHLLWGRAVAGASSSPPPFLSRQIRHLRFCASASYQSAWRKKVHYRSLHEKCTQAQRIYLLLRLERNPTRLLIPLPWLYIVYLSHPGIRFSPGCFTGYFQLRYVPQKRTSLHMPNQDSSRASLILKRTSENTFLFRIVRPLKMPLQAP